MSGLKFSVLVCIVSSVTLGALAGCAVNPPASDNGVEEGPVPGEEAGACLEDGACDEGLDCIENVCVASGSGGDDEVEEYTLLIFHNGSGPMCFAALDWLDDVKAQHPALVIEEHLTYEAGERDLLTEIKEQYQTSQGVSTSFEYLPIMFFEGQAFSGFDDGVAAALQELLPLPGC